MDVSRDTCPLLMQVGLPTNDAKNKDNFIWLPKSPGDFPNCLQQDAELDILWFEKQLAFLKSLTVEERKLLRSYTRNGDAVINIVTRSKTPDKNELMSIVNKLKSPLEDDALETDDIDENGDRIHFSPRKLETRINIFEPTPLESINEKNVIEFAQDYVKRFRDVFNKVPVLENPLRVFRGVSPEEDEDIKVFPLRGFSSTTYDPFTTNIETFVNTQSKCCVMDIVLQPGVRALWIEPISHFANEREILVDSTNVTTTINPTPVLSSAVSINLFTGERKSVTEQLNVFKCEVTPTPPGQQPQNLKTKITNFFRRLTGQTAGMYWPLKYYRGLTRKQNLQRKRSATRRTKMSFKNPKAYAPFKSDNGVKTRKSSYTERFHKKYPDAKSLSEIAKATGISKSILQEVYDRGMAAWRTGHRPGASQHAWGMARVHSFVMKGKTWRTADADLARKV